MFQTPKTITRDNLYDIRTGDALFVKGKSGLINRLIRFFSGAYFVHAAVAVRLEGKLYVVESKYSSSYSYQLTPIDWWFARHSHEQLYVGKMPKENCRRNTRAKIRGIVMDAQESLRPYELCWVFAVYFLQVWLKQCRPQFKRLFKNRQPMICSTLVQEAWERAGVIPVGEYMTPAMLASSLGGETALIPISPEPRGRDPVYPQASNDHMPVPRPQLALVSTTAA